MLFWNRLFPFRRPVIKSGTTSDNAWCVTYIKQHWKIVWIRLIRLGNITTAKWEEVSQARDVKNGEKIENTTPEIAQSGFTIPIHQLQCLRILQKIQLSNNVLFSRQSMKNKANWPQHGTHYGNHRLEVTLSWHNQPHQKNQREKSPRNTNATKVTEM